MATPLNATIEGEPHCVRLDTRNGTLQLTNLTGSSGICPGTRTQTGHYRCCGIKDTCLGYGICHHDKSTHGRSNFYIAGCNDPEYADSIACNGICNTQRRPDIVFDSNTSLWSCCGTGEDGQLRCDEPGQLEFLAPAPDILAKTNSTETVNGTMLGTATITLAGARATTTASDSHSSAHGLSTAAQAGIAIGVIVPVVFFGVVAFFIMKRRQAAKRQAIEMRNMKLPR